MRASTALNLTRTSPGRSSQHSAAAVSPYTMTLPKNVS